MSVSSRLNQGHIIYRRYFHNVYFSNTPQEEQEKFDYVSTKIDYVPPDSLIAYATNIYGYIL